MRGLRQNKRECDAADRGRMRRLPQVLAWGCGNASAAFRVMLQLESEAPIFTRCQTAFRALVALAAVAFAGILHAATAHAEPRLALVIGNAHYASAPLSNPKSDAELMAKTLRGVGFDVTLLVDADQAAMKRAIVELARRLRSAEAVGLFYYAGHGVQVDGENYLIPVGADIASQEEVALNGVSLTELLRTLDRGPSGLNIAILDACRDNPFPARTRSAARGLAPVRAPGGTLIAYATGPGEIALDGAGANSPYSGALAGEIPTAGAALEEVFRRTRRKVLAATGGKQTPWEHSSLTGEFFFRTRAAEPEASARPVTGAGFTEEPRLAELRDWDRIKDSGDPALLRAHIARYPDGLFREIAALKAERIEAPPDPWRWIFTGDERGARSGEAARLYEQAALLDAKSTGATARAEALDLYRRAADLGWPAALYQVGRAYDHGRGVSKDLAEAARWYRRAADAEHPGAMAALGTMYEFGDGLDMSLAEALRYYRMAAERGDPHGMTSLGFLYAAGKGVVRDQAEARRWYATAADRGNARAMYNLSLMLLRGEGGGRDYAGAAKWLDAAVAKGHVGAMRELAFLYDEGRGVAKSPALAARHLLASYKAGNKETRLDIRTRSLAWSFATRRELQRLLSAQGLYTGTAHGILDARTRTALDRYASGN